MQIEDITELTQMFEYNRPVNWKLKTLKIYVSEESEECIILDCDKIEELKELLQDVGEVDDLSGPQGIEFSQTGYIK